MTGSARGIRLGNMSTIDRDEVARVAALARIALTDEEINQFAGELGQIAAAVATVSEAVGPDTKATSHPIEMSNVLRPDIPGECLDREELLAGAPLAEDGQFRVPQIIGEE